VELIENVSREPEILIFEIRHEEHEVHEGKTPRIWLKITFRFVDRHTGMDRRYPGYKDVDVVMIPSMASGFRHSLPERRGLFWDFRKIICNQVPKACLLCFM
jgi:hypothetical protein